MIGYKIMVVDEEPNISNLLEKALNIEGFPAAIKVDTGRKAVTACKEMQPDIMILDVMLPDLDGCEASYNPQKIRITRCVKEWVIDIINDPAFGDRDIIFESVILDQSADIDPELLRRAVTNLVTNALLHNPMDKKVSVLLDADKNGGILLSIRDNGNGLSKSEQSKLFERYYRGTNTKEKPEGSGLGLAIANQIVMLHDGEIAVKSLLGNGTEFIIHIPCENEEAAN